jgi:endonuclease YncB( thermonuclease family)
MKRVYLLLVAIAVSLWFTGVSDVYAKGKRLSGRYKLYKGGKAIDGDTYRYKGKRYRIQQYNAPEIGQPGYRKATQHLQKKLDSGNYKWKPVAKDVYGRTIVKEKKK